MIGFCLLTTLGAWAQANEPASITAEQLCKKWSVKSMGKPGEAMPADMGALLAGAYFEFKTDGTCENQMMGTRQGTWQLLNKGTEIETTSKNRKERLLVKKFSDKTLVLTDPEATLEIVLAVE